MYRISAQSHGGSIRAVFSLEVIYCNFVLVLIALFGLFPPPNPSWQWYLLTVAAELMNTTWCKADSQRELTQSYDKQSAKLCEVLMLNTALSTVYPIQGCQDDHNTIFSFWKWGEIYSAYYHHYYSQRSIAMASVWSVTPLTLVTLLFLPFTPSYCTAAGLDFRSSK